MNVDSPNDGTLRIDLLVKRIPRAIRGHIVAMLGEFIGTLSFIFFAFAGTQTANISSNTNTGTTRVTTVEQKTPQQLLYISLSFGFSLAVNAWIFFRVSGGLFNPAVTLGMVLIGAISILRGVLLFVVQMAGAIAGAYIVDALFSGGLNVDTTLSATTSIAQGVLIEMCLTTLLCFTIFMLAAEKHVGNFIAPIGIGLALFISEMVGVFWTGGSLNPARSFAPAVVSTFHKTQWVYWVGPIAGSILAVIIFKIIKGLEYETVNPDPEALSPTGQQLTDLATTDSKAAENDLEKGDSRTRYGSPEPNTYVRNTIVSDNGVRKPSSATEGVSGIMLNNVNGTSTSSTLNGVNGYTRQAPPVATQEYVVHDYSQPQYPLRTEPMLPPVQAPLMTQRQGGIVEESNWNAIHTANARANTHLVD